MQLFRANVLLLLLSVGASAARLRRSGQQGLPYDYEEVICGYKGEKQGWCVDWLNCLKGKADADASKVLEAWDPADCEEYCGRFPVTSPLEGQSGLLATGSKVGSSNNGTSLLAQVDSWLGHMRAGETALPVLRSLVGGSTHALGQTLRNAEAHAAVKGNAYAKTMAEAEQALHSSSGAEGKKTATQQTAGRVKPSADEMMDELAGGFNCMTTCRKFQEGLSSCVGTIMFEPGSLAKMGAGDDSGADAPDVCTKKDTSCLPDLPLKYQRCLSKSTHAVLDGKKFEDEECATLASDFEDCSDCPIYKQNPMEYISYVGGCKMRLNAYWQATHPHAGKHAHPGASGCMVH